uniref:Tubulin--tyrosine ligase-like protein 9 n=1 Tax=Macrostomum lignano TaxID=282301 RepID=A0A1I8HL02_9PLAT
MLKIELRSATRPLLVFKAFLNGTQTQARQACSLRQSSPGDSDATRRRRPSAMLHQSVAEPTESEARRIIVRFQTEGAGVPDIVREVCEDRNWVEFDPSEHGPNDWNLWWKIGRFRASDFEKLQSWQRLNHHQMGSTSLITTKDGLHREMKILQGTFGKATIDFVPSTYLMPREERQFQQKFAENREKKAANYWIFKPADLSRGRGIFVFNDIGELRYSEKSVVQEYIANPYLIGGYKFDLRLYAVVVSFKPLIVYICREGLVRFGTEKYDLKNLCNVYSHITNTSINVSGPSYDSAKMGIGEGCKWSLSNLRNYLYSQGVNDRLIFARVTAIIVLALMAQAKSATVSTGNCYELYGFDILLDAALKPWLLEVNFSPALNIDCSADAQVKREMLNGVFDLLCFTESDKLQSRGGRQAAGKEKRLSLQSVDSGIASGNSSAKSLRRQRSGGNLSRGVTRTDSLRASESRCSLLESIEELTQAPSESSQASIPGLSRNASSYGGFEEFLRSRQKSARQKQLSEQQLHQQMQRLSRSLTPSLPPGAASKPPLASFKRPPLAKESRLRLLAERDPHALREPADTESETAESEADSDSVKATRRVGAQRGFGGSGPRRVPQSARRLRSSGRIGSSGNKHRQKQQEQEQDVQEALDTGEQERLRQEAEWKARSSPYGDLPITRHWKRPPKQFGAFRLAFPFNRATESACRDVKASERFVVKEVQRLLKHRQRELDEGRIIESAAVCDAEEIWPPVRGLSSEHEIGLLFFTL